MIHAHQLAKGDKGMYAWRAQVLISDYGFPLALDGDFGPKTEAAVKLVQDKMEIEADDEIHWCSAFMNTCCNIAGYAGTGKATARSWLQWEAGTGVITPKLGDLVVFYRGARGGWAGHIAFYAGDDGEYVNAYGGNQGNKVKLSKYPIERVLGFRRAK